jgi:bla regulator protein BlaR1
MMVSVAVLAVVKATLVCGVAFVLARLCRRTRASIRHLLFALAFAALAAIPVAGTLLPAVAVTVPAVATAPARTTQTTPSATPSSAGEDPSRSSALSVIRASAPTALTIAQVATGAWLIGVALFLVPVAIGFWQVRRLRRVASPWLDGQTVVQTLAPAAGVHRPIDVLLQDGVTGPMTCGVLRPAIILPASAREWDESTLKCALRHELEHVARWDFLTHCLSRIVCAACWFHPLVWAAWRRLRLEAERACDDAVLPEADAASYAALLVSIARLEPAGSRQPLLAMAGRGDLATRVAAVLDADQPRGRVGHRQATGLIVAAGIAMAGLAPITVARGMPQATNVAAPTLKFDTVSVQRNAGFGDPELTAMDAAGWVTATNVTARTLVWFAYGFASELRGFHQIENAPEWMDTDRFDVVAKAPPGAKPEQSREMLQSMLLERFNLALHRGSKEFPIYALVLSRPDRSLGPRMARSQTDCAAEPAGCGLSGAGGRLAGRGITTEWLVLNLGKQLHASSQIRLDRPVIDRTGLSGRFDFTLEWPPDPVTRELVAPSQFAQSRLFRPFAFPLESHAPNFLTALREQLGLGFDNQLAPEPVLIIDKIEPPRR